MATIIQRYSDRAKKEKQKVISKKKNFKLMNNAAFEKTKVP